MKERPGIVKKQRWHKHVFQWNPCARYDSQAQNLESYYERLSTK